VYSNNKELEAKILTKSLCDCIIQGNAHTFSSLLNIFLTKILEGKEKFYTKRKLINIEL